MSARESQEISEEERQYEDGSDPSVLDIIAIEMSRPQPQSHQQENHVIDAEYYWVKKGRVSWAQLRTAIEDPAGALWLNGYSSSNGLNDQVPESRVASLRRSLYLVQPDELVLTVGSEGGGFGPSRRRVRARFRVCGLTYRVVVTDPWIQRQLFKQSDGDTEIDKALLCVSLGEVFHGYAYKLAAAVITPERAGG